MPAVLHLTDKVGISAGYLPVFHQFLTRSGLRPVDVLTTSLHSRVPNMLVPKGGNSGGFRVNPEARPNIAHWFDVLVSTAKPRIIVVSCPAALDTLIQSESLQNHRGCNYKYGDIDVIVTYPIGAIHKVAIQKKRTQYDEDEEANFYTVKSGRWLIEQDWNKVGRYFHKRVRPQPAFAHSVVRTLRDLSAMERFLADCALIASDLETSGSLISCAGFCGLHRDGRVYSFVVPFIDKFSDDGCFWSTPETHRNAYECVRRVMESSVPKCGQNFTYDISHFLRNHIAVQGYWLDTIHLWHSLFPELEKKLNYIAAIVLDNVQFWKDDRKGIEQEDVSKRDRTMDKYWRYCALDCYYTLLITLGLGRIALKQQHHLWNYNAEFPNAIVGEVMSMRGMAVDFDVIAQRKLDLDAEIERANRELRIAVSDEEFNPNSPPQVQQLIYDILGAPKIKVRGKVGATDELTLKLIRAKHPFYKLFIDLLWAAKKPMKAKSEYCMLEDKNGNPKGLTFRTDRFRYKLNAAGTETWRYSGQSSDFWDGRNPQNIPEKFRDFCVTDPGWVMFAADYSQSDAFFVAHEANDPDYIRTMLSGKDTHAVHAAHFFKVAYEQVIAGVKAKDPFYVHPTKGIRPLTKRVVHGANFQMAGATLYATMGRDAVVAAATALGQRGASIWSDQQLTLFCDALLGSFRKLYLRLSKRGWYGEIEATIRSKQRIVNAYGMTRMVMGDASDPATQREACAFYGQSGTAGNVNRSLRELTFGKIPRRFRDGENPHAGETPIQLDEAFTGKRTGLRFNMQGHDSINGLIRRELFDENARKLLTVMERPCIINGHTFSVSVEIKYGFRWGESMLKWNPEKNIDWDALEATL
jgi:DNA polymerase I-like protein with 3'-5' exonuclease and polymerase domains